MQAIITPSEADSRLSKTLSAAETMQCPLHKAAGRVLREAICADRPLPPFDRVMMDGIAVRRADLKSMSGERTFQILGTQLAGDAETSLPAHPMAAMEAMTGAVCPQGADCIVPVEQLTRCGATVQVDARFETPSTGFIHRLGSDYAQGTVLVKPGVRIGPNEMAIAASCGVSAPVVSRLPRVAMAATGDELVAPDTTPLPHQIRASNQPALQAALSLAGFPALTAVHLADDPRTLPDAVEGLLQQHDVVLFTGGISKGKTDYLPGIFDASGAECLFHGVAQRPGKPMGAWQRGSTLVFALPGNPVSALTCFHRYVLPALERHSGLDPRTRFAVKLDKDISFKAPLSYFCPVVLTRRGAVAPLEVRNSGDFAGLCGSDGFIELPPDRSDYRNGESFLFTPWIGGSPL